MPRGSKPEPGELLVNLLGSAPPRSRGGGYVRSGPRGGEALARTCRASSYLPSPARSALQLASIARAFFTAEANSGSRLMARK
jgi:hypothetical protein